jgi:hypothetical protein
MVLVALLLLVVLPCSHGGAIFFPVWAMTTPPPNTATHTSPTRPGLFRLIISKLTEVALKRRIMGQSTRHPSYLDWTGLAALRSLHALHARARAREANALCSSRAAVSGF